MSIRALLHPRCLILMQCAQSKLWTGQPRLLFWKVLNTFKLHLLFVILHSQLFILDLYFREAPRAFTQKKTLSTIAEVVLQWSAETQSQEVSLSTMIQCLDPLHYHGFGLLCFCGMPRDALCFGKVAATLRSPWSVVALLCTGTHRRN